MISLIKSNLGRIGTTGRESSFSRVARKGGRFSSLSALSGLHFSLIKTCVFLVGLLIGAAAPAQNYDQKTPFREQMEYTRAHYTKYDYRIPMRDGIKAFYYGLCAEGFRAKPILC